MSKRYTRTPEDDAKSAERAQRRQEREQARMSTAAAERRATEEKIQRQRAQPAYSSLRELGNLGIVGLKGSDTDYLMDGLEACVDKAGGQIVTLPASGNIQGDDLGMEQATDTLTLASQLRRDPEISGTRVLAFLDFNFNDVRTTGTPGVTRRIIEIINRQNDSGNKQDDLCVLVVGNGEFDDLPASSHFDSSRQQAVAGILALRIGLDAENELSVAPELKPATPDPECMSSFAHLLPNSITGRH